MPLEKTSFFSAVRPIFAGTLTQPQVDGLNQILDEWDRRALTDPRWLAYMLATVKWETGSKMQPVREGGGEDYLRKKPYYPWVGEGLVQVTWEINARKFGATSPGQLMTWPIALKALFDGMIGGMFTGKKLADYFTPAVTDPVNARRIINGTDKAAEIAALYKQFYVVVVAALSTASVALAPAIVAPPPPAAATSPVTSITNWVAGAGAGIPAAAAVIKGAADTVNGNVIQINDAAGAVKRTVTTIQDSTNTVAGYVNWHMPPWLLAALGLIGIVAIGVVIYRHSQLRKVAA